MNSVTMQIAGETVLLDPAGVLFWPAAGLLAVADLHLEKGSACARRGAMVPPWDSQVTLRRLLACVARWQPRIVVALGDSFHDRGAAARLPSDETALLHRLAAQTRMIWVLGNHDPMPPAQFAGEAALQFNLGPFRFRHEASGAVAPDTAELCGHHHPKARIMTRGGNVGRPCFVAGPSRVLLPAFGAYTGGLDVTSPAISRLFADGARIFLLGRARLFAFDLEPPTRSEPAALSAVEAS